MARVTQLPDEDQARLLEQATGEQAVIDQHGLADYFLLAADIIEEAGQAGIVSGPGRGSSVASAVAYLLGITRVNPAEHGLLPERFLSPARPDLPDIDIDIQSCRIDELLDHLRTRYGSGCVFRSLTPVRQPHPTNTSQTSTDGPAGDDARRRVGSGRRSTTAPCSSPANPSTHWSRSSTATASWWPPGTIKTWPKPD